MTTTKQERERAFHNAAFSDQRRSAVVNAYAIIHDSRVYYEEFVRQHSRGASLLEYGCGATAIASRVGRDAAQIVGIDISDVAVRKATELAEETGLNARYFVMDAETLAFPDQTFDLVCSVAILHHLDLNRACGELARVLKPGGAAIFMEPLGHNPLINWYRRRTPDLRTVDEHPLMWSDFEVAREHFEKVDCRFFALASLMAIPLAGVAGFRPVLGILERVDRLLFKSRLLQRYAWQVVIVLSSPRQRSHPA